MSIATFTAPLELPTGVDRASSAEGSRLGLLDAQARQSLIGLPGLRLDGPHSTNPTFECKTDCGHLPGGARAPGILRRPFRTPLATSLMTYYMSLPTETDIHGSVRP